MSDSTIARFENVAPRPGEKMLATLRSKSGSYLPETLGERWELAQAFCRSQIVPSSYRGKPADVFYAMEFGRELGLSPVQSLQNIAVIGGRAAIWGQSLLAVVRVRAGDQLTKFKETWDPDKDGGTWTTEVQRNDEDPVIRSFSMKEAMKIEVYANGKKEILGKKDTYQNYGRRMCKFKARGEALNDAFGDILLGLLTREEADEWIGDTVDAEVVGRSEPSADDAIADLMSTLDDETMTAIAEGFDTLSMGKGQRLSKLRSFQGREAELVEWLRNEWTKRKSQGAHATPVRRAAAEPGKPAPKPAKPSAQGAEAERETSSGASSDAGGDTEAPSADDIFGDDSAAVI